MNYYWASERSNGRSIKVEWAVVVLSGRYRRFNVELMAEVERELGLLEELVPQEVWECAGHTCENR